MQGENEVSHGLYNLVTWQNFNNLIKQCFNINFRKVDNFFMPNTVWHRLNGWEQLEDVEIFQYLADLRAFEGMLFVITDACYQDSMGPFHLNATNINDFAKDHLNNFGECLFNTDVLVISIELKLVWIFHHEGVYGLVDLN
jgi:hypothetical protein